MIAPLRRLLRGKAVTASLQQAAVPEGQRVFAIGDVHGRADLFEALAAAIEAEDAARAPAHTTIVLLGDLIDRGPDSARVLGLARDWRCRHLERGGAFHILMGNHEEMLLESLERVDVLRHFVTFGGKETILSLGVPETTYAEATWDELQAFLAQVFSGEWLDFVQNFETLVRIGDYAFVHAGVRPDLPLEAQAPKDLRWIREPFLSSSAEYGAVVVHGHTISDEPVLRPNRIGIDTGAYASGRLTALMLEGTQRWYLTASEVEGAITTHRAPAA